MREYDEQFLVECEVCDKKFRVINAFHLREHELSVDEYLARYPNAKLSNIPCEECGTLITDSRSAWRSYCDDCVKEVRRRKNRESKRRREREMHRNVSPRDIAVIKDRHYPGLGTSGPSTWLSKITIDGVDRIEGAVWLQKEMKKRGARTDIQSRPAEVSGPNSE